MVLLRLCVTPVLAAGLYNVCNGFFVFQVEGCTEAGAAPAEQSH